MDIEQINKLIEEIEKENQEYQKYLQERKKKKIANKRKKIQRKILLSFGLPTTLITMINFYQFFSYHTKNIYKSNHLAVSEQKINQMKTIIENNLNIKIEDNNIENYMLLNAIIENSNLTNEEKELTSTSIIQLIDDIPYLNKEEAYHSLLNLDICYLNRPIYEKKTILAKYIYRLPFHIYINQIHMYVENVEGVLEHELIHCLLMNSQNVHYPCFLTEGITQLLKNEYFNRNPYIELSIYPYEINVVKMLCEILDAETILESYVTGNINIIYKKLTELNSNIDAKKFIKLLNELLLDYKLYNNQEKMLAVNHLKNELVIYFNQSPNSKIEQSRKAFEYYLTLFEVLKEEDPYTQYLNIINDNQYVPICYINEFKLTRQKK